MFINRKSNVSYLKCVAFFSFIRLNNSHISSKVTVSRQSVSKWESAKNYPSLDILIAMSDLFGITLDHLIKGDACFKKSYFRGKL